LHLAAAVGQEEVVNTLVRLGARWDAVDIAGITPLMAAAWEGQVAVVEVLLSVPGLGYEHIRGAYHAAIDAGKGQVAAVIARQLQQQDPGLLQDLIGAAGPLVQALIGQWQGAESSVEEERGLRVAREEELQVERRGLQELYVQVAAAAKTLHRRQDRS